MGHVPRAHDEARGSDATASLPRTADQLRRRRHTNNAAGTNRSSAPNSPRRGAVTSHPLSTGRRVVGWTATVAVDVATDVRGTVRVAVLVPGGVSVCVLSTVPVNVCPSVSVAVGVAAVLVAL